jgi:hypothetical protein
MADAPARHVTFRGGVEMAELFLLHRSFSKRLTHLSNVWAGEISSHNLTHVPTGYRHRLKGRAMATA